MTNRLVPLSPFASVLLAAICALNAAACLAQSNPKEFFKHGFAGSAGGQAEDEYRITPLPLPTPDKGAQGATKDVTSGESEIADSSVEVGEGAETIVTPVAETELEMEPIPVHSIGAIISSMDKQHLLECFKELTDTAISTDRMVAQVYTIGDLRNLEAAKNYIYKMIARGGDVSVKDSVPRKYKKVTMSPTWILKTEKGEILLEATGPLAANFNAKGEFVDKNRRNQLVEANLTPLPTTTPNPEPTMVVQ